jgi:hypothetical protein
MAVLVDLTNPPRPPQNPALKAGFFCQSTLTINTMKNRKINRPMTTASITTEMLAQVAREIPEPDAGFRNERARRDFQHRRNQRFATLQAGMQWFLETHCEDDIERQMTLDEYRKQSATFAALHQARN